MELLCFILIFVECCYSAIYSGTTFKKITIEAASIGSATNIKSVATKSLIECSAFCMTFFWCTLFYVSTDDICFATDAPFTFAPSYSSPLDCYVFETFDLSAIPVLSFGAWLPDNPKTYTDRTLRYWWIYNTPLIDESHPFTTMADCKSLCDARPWCTAACHVPHRSECRVTDMLLAPGYVDPNLTGNLMTCGTVLETDLLFGKASDGIYDPVNLGPEYLTKGINVFRVDKSCTKLFKSNVPSMYFDFGAQVSFNKIILTTSLQSSPDKLLPHSLKIYVGNVDPLGTDNFVNTFDMVFQFPASGILKQTSYIIPVNVVNKRFLAFKKERYTPDVDQQSKYLQVCYLQILNN